MKKLAQFSVDHAWLVISLTLGLTLPFAAQLPQIKTDTDPKNMLPVTPPVRQYNDQVEGWFALQPDVILLGIQSENGIFTAETLRHIEDFSQAILKIRANPSLQSAVLLSVRGAATVRLPYKFFSGLHVFRDGGP